jgi:class 3 adenylate cyclase
MERKMALNTATQVLDTQSFDSEDNNWMTAKAVMDTTGISKADLVQFIQMNMLPKSLMRVQPAVHDVTRKKSYFSKTILGHLAMLKLLRDEGHSVETIADKLGQAEKNHQTPLEQLTWDIKSAELTKVKKTTDTPPLHFIFPAGAITGSAFFVDSKMHIGWITVAQDDGLFKTIHDEMNDDPSSSVFDILLRASLKELVFNWQPLFSFIYRFLEEITPAETFKRVAPLVSLHLEGLQHPKFFMARLPKGCPRIDSCPIRIEDEKGHMQAMRLYAIALSEGALFVFEKEYWHNSHWEMIEGPLSNGSSASKSTDGKTPFSVISARLENSQRLVHTLLPETYYQLINRIWDESDRIVISYGGQRAKRSGTEVQYIIPRHAGTDPAYDAIRCTIDLRKTVREIEASLKGNAGWFADIRINMGISSGKDYLPAEDLTASMAFMLPGGAADQAFHLSAIAQGGSILITKSAFGHLSQQQMQGITFGIYRNKQLIPKIFAQLSELPQNSDTPPMAQDIRSLFVTGIVDLNTNQHRDSD